MLSTPSSEDAPPEDLQRRLKVEQILSEISARFVSFSNLDEMIIRSLADMGELIQADFAGLFLTHGNNTMISNMHEWVRPGARSTMSMMQDLLVQRVPWWMHQLESGNSIIVPDVTSLPPEAQAERELYEKNNIKSALIFPLYLGSELGGFLGIAATRRPRNWGAEDVRVLRVCAEIMGGAMTRKRAEEALRESEAQLRAQYRGIPIPTFTWQWSKAGGGFTLIDYNDAAMVFTEGHVAKFLGKTAREMYPDRPEIQEDLSRCFMEQITLKREMPYQFEVTGQHKELAVSYVFVPPDLVMVHTEDITVRKQAEEALRKSEARLVEAQRIAHLGNWDWNITTNEVWWSDEIYRIFGLTPQEFDATYEAFLNSVHPDDRGMVKNAVNEALYQKKPYSIEFRIVQPDGTERIVHEQAEVFLNQKGEPVRMIGTVHDITVRKQAEAALQRAKEELESRVEQRTAELREREHRYRALFDRTNDVVFLISPDGRTPPRRESASGRYVGVYRGRAGWDVHIAIDCTDRTAG